VRAEDAAGDTAYAIVMSAYDGASYLEAQLESIRGQSAGHWRLYARDDGSRDDTAQRLREWARRDPRIEVLANDGRNLGPAASFEVLLQHALDRGERYVFLSDQDDVWLPDKCARMLALMREREVAAGRDVPVLVHSDLRVVDRDLAPVHPSFIAQHRIDAKEERRATRLLVGNSVTGCAALVNAALLRCALPMPEVAMHDWWLAQCAGAFGELAFLDEPTVLHRQHGANTVGARGLMERARAILHSPRVWWIASARRFLRGLHQDWVLRARARTRGLPMAAPVRESLDVLWEGLGAAGGTLLSRVVAAGRSGALPRSYMMRCLFLSRVALLPVLRDRLGDDRDGVHP
jgi:glycosyltransferase involved in cell wall biosynthesis